MAFENTRFTLMCFPQGVDQNGKLTIHIVLLPRNISPLDKVNSIYAAGGKAEAFVNLRPQFDVKVVNDPSEFPGKVPANERTAATAPLAYPANINTLYKTLKEVRIPAPTPSNPQATKAKYFDIDENRSTDKPGAQRAPAAGNKATAIKKYLPVSYRESFNFTSPRVPNAVTDDSYHCALRDQQVPAGIVVDNKISWGKVYAHLMRQPLMAMAGGLLYKTSVQLTPTDLLKGGWIYVDIKPGTTYATEQAASIAGAGDHFIKRYAARLPALKIGVARSLFAAVLFPVMETGINPTGIYDDLFIEASRYNDGFATVVHANQPVSQNLLQEEQDGFHPQHEIGIRLGWEDEQILIWYLRQLAKDDTAGNDRLDAPLGVMGYHVDVREAGSPAWESLTAVQSDNMMLENIPIGRYDGELPYQVYPTKLYGANSNQFWLPMYFANWNDTSLVQPDRIAAEIYQNDKDTKTPVKISSTYKQVKANTRLRYGKSYEFRVRLSDMSGGGPSYTLPEPPKELPSHIAPADFKRYLAPNALRILNRRVDVSGALAPRTLTDDILINTDSINFKGTVIRLARPVLGYPAVEFTGRYTDAVARLKAAAVAGVAKNEAFGIADPDVVKVEIHVEVETLQMDNLASKDGQEHYITLYKTYRNFDPANFDAELQVPVTYQDFPQLKLTDQVKPFRLDDAANATIAATSGTIILPTSRDLRITLRAVCDKDESYWGNTHPNPDRDARYGKKTTIRVRKDSANEQNLFKGMADPKFLQGIYLQPDPFMLKLDPVFFKALQGGSDGIPNIVQRLARQLDVQSKDTTLIADRGERIQFWCSNLIRHSMAPDNSSLTFANRNELDNHWLVCTSFYLDRDWSWDGFDASSIDIRRRRSWGSSPVNEAQPYTFIGDLEMRRIASFQAIQPGSDGLVHREYTRIIIIDIVDGTPAGNDHPDTLRVQYELKPKFRSGHTPVADDALETQRLLLPVTVNPRQMPKLIGAGVALSPYNRNPQYSATEARQRFLWLEFDKAPANPDDGLFARVLAYAPDQLLSNNHPDLMEIPDESPLPLDPEYIRVITTEAGGEHAGLSAMQKMEKSVDEERHFYLLPLPPGLHSESPELFGFYTYEFRYGHTDKVWSTAQGRFGRALRVTGLQHPAPNIYAMVDRSEKEITVSAPYAQAVFNGRNVTSDPPRTAIWCLLYAQVRQADGLDYRNILLNETELTPRPRSRHDQPFRTKIAAAMKLKNQPLAMQLTNQYNQLKALEKEGILHAHGTWQNTDVAQMLALYGLPEDSPLSVVCVEVSGTVTSAFDHFSNLDTSLVDALDESLTSTYNAAVGDAAKAQLNDDLIKKGGIVNRPIQPLTGNLGQYRILRTSPLTEVPFICCTD